MARTRKLEIEITDTRKGTGFKDASADVDTFGDKITKGSQSWASSLANFAKVAAVGLAVVGTAAVKFGLDAVHAAEEAAQVTSQTEAVIKSMGLSAQVSGDQIAGLSEKLSLKTGIDDELIQSGQNVLLTFGALATSAGQTGGNFDRATAAALDMSVALGTDMTSASMMVGKALNDPIRGLTALRRSGIQFTAEQEEQIKAMVEVGDVAGAQALMLSELERQFGGSAEAQATASQKMSVAWGNLQEKLGEKLLPVFEAVSEWITSTLVPAIERFADWIEREGVPALEDFGGWLGDNIVPAIQLLASWLTGTLIPALVNLGAWFTEHQRVLAAVAIGIVAALVPAFIAWAIAAGTAAIATIAAAAPLILIGLAVAALAYLIITHWDTIKAATMAAWDFVLGVIKGVWNWISENWPLLLAILTGPIGMAVYLISQHWETIKSGISAVKDWIVDRFNDVIGFITGLPGAIADAAAGMWDGITSAFKSAINAIIGLWNNFSISFGGYDIPGPGPNIPSFTIDTPNIPYLAEGGVATRPMLAEIGHGGGEAIVPLDRWDDMGGGGGTVNIDLRGAIISSEQQAERWVTQAVNRARSKGVI